MFHWCCFPGIFVPDIVVLASENLEKNATAFNDWIKTRDDQFKTRHSIPEMSNYDLDYFQDFIEKRKEILTKVLQNI